MSGSNSLQVDLDAAIARALENYVDDMAVNIDLSTMLQPGEAENPQLEDVKGIDENKPEGAEDKNLHVKENEKKTVKEVKKRDVADKKYKKNKREKEWDKAWDKAVGVEEGVEAKNSNPQPPLPPPVASQSSGSRGKNLESMLKIYREENPEGFTSRNSGQSGGTPSKRVRAVPGGIGLGVGALADEEEKERVKKYQVVKAKEVMKRAAEKLEEKGVKRKKGTPSQLEKSESMRDNNIDQDEDNMTRSRSLPVTKKQYIKADPTTYVDITCPAVNTFNMARFLGYLDFNYKNDSYGESWDGDQAVAGKVLVGGKLRPRVQTLSPHFPPHHT